MVAKKRGLGKGLAALIPDDPMVNLFNEDETKETVFNVELSLVEPNKSQPRQEFSKESLEDLKDSILQYGVIQPIVVRKKGKKYEIVAGERRWRAAKAASLKDIPCIVKELDDRQAMKLALIENIQRENLNPIEEANAFKGLIDNYNLTQEEVAKAVGKSRSYIANTVRLLNLDETIVDYISKGQITSGHGRALLAIKNKKERLNALETIVNNKINVREAENIVKKVNKRKTKRTMTKEDPFIKEIEENLMRALGTKVRLIAKKDGGKIEIEYYGDEDLERLIEFIIT